MKSKILKIKLCNYRLLIALVLNAQLLCANAGTGVDSKTTSDEDASGSQTLTKVLHLEGSSVSTSPQSLPLIDTLIPVQPVTDAQVSLYNQIKAPRQIESLKHILATSQNNDLISVLSTLLNNDASMDTRFNQLNFPNQFSHDDLSLLVDTFYIFFSPTEILDLTKQYYASAIDSRFYGLPDALKPDRSNLRTALTENAT